MTDTILRIIKEDLKVSNEEVKVYKIDIKKIINILVQSFPDNPSILQLELLYDGANIFLNEDYMDYMNSFILMYENEIKEFNEMKLLNEDYSRHINVEKLDKNGKNYSSKFKEIINSIKINYNLLPENDRQRLRKIFLKVIKNSYKRQIRKLECKEESKETEYENWYNEFKRMNGY